MVLKPPVALVGKSAPSGRSATSDILIDLSTRADHAMKESVAPRHFIQQRILRETSVLKFFANPLTQREQRVNMVEREGQPLPEVAGVVPAAGRGMRITIGVEYAMNAEDRTAAALGAQKGQIARDDAIVDALANGEGRRDLPVRLDLVATRGLEPAEVGLPKGPPTAGIPSQFAHI